jgi:8-oxo-dGTP pyrophosphatase MutT (NUDIX family)
MFNKTMFKTVQRLFLQPFFRQTRGLTLGTRTLIVRPSGEILLVRHTYAPGWLMPGGGVERGETVFEAAAREVREEAGIIAEEEPVLHGLFLNERQFPGDHVACFALRQFRETPFKPNVEIAEGRWFARDALPEGTTGGTKRRIAEVLDGVKAERVW